MNAYFRIAACTFFASAFSASDAAAQPVVVTEAETVALSSATPRTATETMQDFIRSEESRVCSELKKFARQTILKDPAVLRYYDKTQINVVGHIYKERGSDRAENR